MGVFPRFAGENTRMHTAALVAFGIVNNPDNRGEF